MAAAVVAVVEERRSCSWQYISRGSTELFKSSTGGADAPIRNLLIQVGAGSFDRKSPESKQTAISLQHAIVPKFLWERPLLARRKSQDSRRLPRNGRLFFSPGLSSPALFSTRGSPFFHGSLRGNGQIQTRVSTLCHSRRFSSCRAFSAASLLAVMPAYFSRQR